MGYDVKYACTLYANDTAVDLTFHYGRGTCGWEGDAPPPDHEGEGLLEVPEQESTGEWMITIKNGSVTMKHMSEKFYDHYMMRMLRLLKERVPSLHGYVSCDLDIYWVVTSEVRRYNLPNIHEFARIKYEGEQANSRVAQAFPQ